MNINTLMKISRNDYLKMKSRLEWLEVENEVLNKTLKVLEDREARKAEKTVAKTDKKGDK